MLSPKPTSPKPTSPEPTSPKPDSSKPDSPKPDSPKPDSPKPKRRRVDLTWDAKRKVCEAHYDHPAYSQEELARHLVEHCGFQLIDRSTISKILRESSKWMGVEGSKMRAREAKWPQVERSLILWIGQIRARRGTLNDSMLLMKAEEFRNSFGISAGELRLSHGWLDKFKKRHGIACYNVDGESVSQARLPLLLQEYDPEDVFNFDETGLYYRALPSKGFRGVKDRVTLGLCTNTSGKERLKMIFIHTRALPKSFKPDILVHYYSNKTAWMNAEIFTHWVTSENERMAKEGRKILVLLDNAGSHQVTGVEKATKCGFDAYVLSNITLLFLPPTMTYIVQPLDQGIIASLKMRYKGKLVRWTLDQFARSMDLESANVDLLQCMIWVVGAWNEIEAETIQNCWRVSNSLPRTPNCADVRSVQEKLKARMKVEADELEKLLAALDLRNIQSGQPIEKMTVMEFMNMADEDCIEAEYTTEQIVKLVGSGQQPLMGDEHDEEEHSDHHVEIERPGVQLFEAKAYSQKLLDFMLREGSENFGCSELLHMERICDKLSKLAVAHATKQCGVNSFMM